MNKIILTKSKNISECTIQLPSSKSIANRVLMIQKLCTEKFIIKNLSSAHDTSILQNALNSNHSTIDIEDAGTACRFMCAYLALKNTEQILTGTDRMKQRPIKPLVDALNSLGAKITYIEKEGFLPLHFHKSTIVGGSIQIDASLSSQYISALLLIAPLLQNGLHIHFNDLVSKDYVLMTIELMKYFGIEIIVHEQSIEIKQQKYQAKNISIESDWSSASYFFSMSSLIPNSRIQLNNLTVYSLQGDSVCSYITTQLGAETHLLGDNIAVRYEENNLEFFEFDFRNCPDLVMTFAVLCAIKNIPAKFYHIQHLAHKESNRLIALKTELAKINCRFEEEKNYWNLIPGDFNKNESIEIETYNDHRIAMAFAPLALICKKIIIQNPEVVNKSFPTFWNEIEKLGIEIKNI